MYEYVCALSLLTFVIVSIWTSMKGKFKYELMNKWMVRYGVDINKWKTNIWINKRRNEWINVWAVFMDKLGAKQLAKYQT